MENEEEDSWLLDDYQEAADFLYSFVAPLAVRGVGDEEGPSVKLNPNLDEDQLEEVQEIFDIVEALPVHAVAHHILGFLCLSDIMTE